MIDATVLYYSSGREEPDFERRVQENLLKVSSGLPIISVVQKATVGFGLGEVICVGDVGCSGFNMFRQVQIACLSARTRFVISAEADCLYPPDYFTFAPEHDDRCYRNSNLFVMPDARDYFFYKKEGATHAQIVGREFYLDRLTKLFEDAPDWSTEEFNFPKERHHQEDIFPPEQIEHYVTPNPIIQIKTHRGMRYFTHSDRTPIPSLPYWGDGKAVRAYYLHGKRL